MTPLCEAERAELDAWLLEHGASLPAPVQVALAQHRALLDGLNGSQHKLSQVLSELRRALGIAPKSERRVSKDPLGHQGGRVRKKSLRERLEDKALRGESLSAWHTRLGKRHSLRAKVIRKKLMKLPEGVDDTGDLDDEELSAEELAAHAKAGREHAARLGLGEGSDARFETAREAFIAGAQIATHEEQEPRPVSAPACAEGERVIDTVVEPRERFDFSFTVTRVPLAVEKKVVIGRDGERRIASGSTLEIGPPRYAVTWEFLANMSVLVVQYAMPMNRLGTLLSTDDKRFSAGSLARMLRYVARRFAPIYLSLVDSLCDSEILSGDDTSCRVLEVNRHFAENEADALAPWSAYRTREAARQYMAASPDAKESLAAALGSELGFEFGRRNGDGAKKALHTTTVSGRSDASDPRSLVVIYRSHLGSLGNVLEMLLAKRNPKAKALTIQSDLATVNLVADAELHRRFDIRHVGCASHARRPFALYEDEDPETCGLMLHLFQGLFLHEQNLSATGRNAENVTAVRKDDSRPVWLMIKELASEMSQQWSRETKLGEGARYITRNYDKLTAYLDDPRLELTNNFSERMLRLEKLIEASSLFRTTLEGRFALDVMRSVLQTAVAARAPLQEYLLGVLRTSPDDVAAEPERFTPRAWLETNRRAYAAIEAALREDDNAATG